MCSENKVPIEKCKDPDANTYTNECWNEIEAALLECGLDKSDSDVKRLKGFYTGISIKTHSMMEMFNFIDWLLADTVKTSTSKEQRECTIWKIMLRFNTLEEYQREALIPDLVVELEVILNVLIPKRTIHFP